MLIKDYSFITDENIPPQVVSFIRNTGIDVFDIKEQGLSSTSDASIIQLAIETNRIILTQDSDFGTLFFKEAMKLTGIVYIRPGHAASSELIKIISSLFNQEIDITIPFIIVAELLSDKIKIRIRELGANPNAM